MAVKNDNFQMTNRDFFHTFGQNIDCGHALEPPHKCSMNEHPQSVLEKKVRKILHTPLNTSFTI